MEARRNMEPPAQGAPDEDEQMAPTSDEDSDYA